MGQFKQIDVFTLKKFRGTPVAVFFDADELTKDQMLRIANWTNLSETAFVFKPTSPNANYGLRVFKASSEILFSGPPAIASCHALLEAGLIEPNDEGEVIQECKDGLVKLTITEDGVISFRFSDYEHYKHENNEQVLSYLGLTTDQILKCMVVDDGSKWLVLQLKTPKEALDLDPDYRDIAEFSRNSDVLGIKVFGRHDDGTYEIRDFTSIDGLNENPMFCTGAGAIGSILAEEYGFTGELVIRQGLTTKRSGEIKVVAKKVGDSEYDVQVGGKAITCINGSY